MDNLMNSEELEPVGRSNEIEMNAWMWVDLMQDRQKLEGAEQRLTKRAEIYMQAAGLPLDQVLDALKISRATWYRRVEALRAWEANNRAAHRKYSIVVKDDEGEEEG